MADDHLKPLRDSLIPCCDDYNADEALRAMASAMPVGPGNFTLSPSQIPDLNLSIHPVGMKNARGAGRTKECAPREQETRQIQTAGFS